MDNYRKGKNVEEPLEKNRLPIPNLTSEFVWMQVRGGSKMRDLLSYAFKEFETANSIVWTGFGPSVGKAVSCAEIMKREYSSELHQITKICYRMVQEYWDPKIPELEQIVVERKLPMIHILLSKEPLNSQELGYQGPGVKISLDDVDEVTEKRKYLQSRTPTKEFAALGVGSMNRPKKWSKSNKKFDKGQSSTSNM
ncbi:hypothetical protein PPYR_12333 [Photinus pyralis]|uniref:DNA/RNA-binding protein Alba-like domain-containing protein n=1 Tax=Photinus pyralis TaxID=7054 RepID=A0A1Y1NAV1_PHOPY|nr:ribonuclease P protein subunit p25-like protein [Photinus pyralis]XP_031351715.1 ribonuclease P protein subunit p25-like protein [Photinus pyralis]XP_031351716.1 ribonuclease P protein subunit p25-like protein [Photinus pyralis]KAB0795494.1 hypothetical protein PPYR_12333 [Photinus pyralis]